MTFAVTTRSGATNMTIAEGSGRGAVGVIFPLVLGVVIHLARRADIVPVCNNGLAQHCTQSGLSGADSPGGSGTSATFSTIDTRL
jgi:hypothetical protein